MNTKEETARFSIGRLVGGTRASRPRKRERARRLTLESLERRELLTVSIQAFPNATTSSGNTSITSLAGHLWVAENIGKTAIAEVATDGTLVNEFALPPRGQAGAPPRPQDIVASPDGNLWFSTSGSGPNATGGLKDGLATMTTSGQFTFFDVPEDNAPLAITIGPDDRPWFLETTDLVRVNPSNQFTVFPLGSESGKTLGNQPGSLTVGPNLPNGDKTLYFTEANGYHLVQFDVTASVANDTSTSTAIPLPAQYNANRSIVAGPGGTLWFGGGSNGGSVLGQYDPATGTFSSHFDTTPNSPFGSAGQLTVLGGNIWFTVDAQYIGEYDTTANVFHSYPVAGAAHPYSITSGPDGNLWFTDRVSGALLRASLGPVASANLSLDAGATASTVPLGNSFSYTAKITNTGTADASNIVLTARLPDGFNYTGPNGDRGFSFDGAHTVAFTQPTLLAGYAVTVSIPGGTSAVGVLGGNSTIDTMTVRSDTTLATTPTSFPAVTVTQATAGLTFTGGATTITVHPGDDFSYTIDELNAGPSDDSNLNVVVHLPAAVTYTGPLDTSGNLVILYNHDATTNDLTYTQSSVPVSTTPTRVTIPVHVATTADTTSPLAADASASSDLNLIAQSISFPSVAVTAAAPSADLVLSNPTVSASSAKVGDVLTYSLTIANVGQAGATNVVNVTQLAPSLAYVGPANDPHYRVLNLPSGSYVVYTPSDLAGSSQPIAETFQARVAAVAGQPANQPIPAMLSHVSGSQADPTGANNYAAFPSIPVSDPSTSHLGVEIQGPGGTVATSDQDVAYTVTITNNGPATATGVRFNVVLPPASGLTFVSSTRPINTPIGSLAPKASLTTVIHALTNGGGANSTATMTVITSCVNSPANVAGGSSISLVAPVPVFPLTLSLVAAPTSLTLNSRFEGLLAYTFKITNTTAATINGATFVDVLPGGISTISVQVLGSSGQWQTLPANTVDQSSGVVTWSMPPVAPHSSIAVFVAGLVDATTASLNLGETLSNSAYVKPGDAGGNASGLLDFHTTLVVPAHTVNFMSPPATVAKPAAAFLSATKKAIARLSLPKTIVQNGFRATLHGNLTLKSLTADSLHQVVRGTATVIYLVSGVPLTVTMTFFESYPIPPVTVLKPVDFGTLYDGFVNAATHQKIQAVLSALVSNKANNANIVKSLPHA